MRLGHAHRHHHALAGGEAVGLDDDRCAAPRDVVARLLRVGEHRVAGGGNAVALEKALGEGLAGLQLGRGLCGPEDAQARGGEGIDHAERERTLGSDHGQRHGLALREREQARQVIGGDGDVAAARLGGRPRVAGGDEHLLHGGGLGQLPGQGVFAATRADDEEFHVRPCRVGRAL